MREKIEVSVILPCRNEESAVAACVKEARAFLVQLGVEGEILVVDNASEDASARIAKESGARVIRQPLPGYGRALRAGIRAGRGEYLLMADCDTTYELKELEKLYHKLKDDGCDMVIGDRFAGGIEPGAMPFSHKLGAEVLSALGRRRFHCEVKDFHCGIRGLSREAAKRLKLRTAGMEFATEMIALASAAGMRIGQVPVQLKKARFPRMSKLRTLRDGFRHLRYILVYK
ncbi:MAG: glycosyltransferase family 2 protein [Lachnospiraceae bacterium]|nr:glycosyltransferase family 2 protein [Lachnospiraceae bacterium]